MTADAPVYVEVVCPSCEGRCCVVCRHTGTVHARLADAGAPTCARCAVHCDAVADTERPPPDDDEDTSP
jgi:hypothetical protein